jgi:hypothetical protein
MKFIEKNRARFDIMLPETEVEMSNELINGSGFEKKLVLIINNQFENIFGSNLNASTIDVIKFSFDENCKELSFGEFGFIIKNILYIIEHTRISSHYDYLRGVSKMTYKAYKMDCHFQFFTGYFPFKFLNSTSADYKFIKINLSPDEQALRDLPF